MSQRKRFEKYFFFILLLLGFLIVFPRSADAQSVDNDGDGYTTVQGDCDDTDPKVYPRAPRICDGKDNDCDGRQDFITDTDKDKDGVFWCAGDCDDNNPNRFPGNTEGPFGSPTCSDGTDNDCDNRVDATDTGCMSACLDNDKDGYGANGDPSCPLGTEVDCNDNNVNINPGASDSNCDGFDDNCSGTADDGYVPTPTTCGIGACTRTGQNICQNGFIVNTCTPGAPQTEGPFGNPTCSDSIDNDCDGTTDMNEVSCACLDNDNDGYGANGNILCPNGPAADCNDANANINPGDPDNTCNSIDENCSGVADEQYVPSATTCGLGICTSTGQNICVSGAVVNTCLPGTPQTEGPFDSPTCSDSLDNDCDGLVDILDIGCRSDYFDADGDGFTPQQGDCDDTNNKVYPGAPRICDGKDNDCDGRVDFTTDVDKDNDGVLWCNSDCDDNNPNKFPGNIEGPFGAAVCSDGLDNDCDSKADMADPGCMSNCVDNDGDGYGIYGDPSCPKGTAIDCNDTNFNINPGKTDNNCNGIDENCSGAADEGYVPTATTCGTGACAATGQNVCQNGAVVNTCTPGAPQTEGPFGNITCSDGIDNNCNGKTDAADNNCAAVCIDNDGDGYGANGNPVCANGPAVDCNDNNAGINPGSLDNTCNGIDENCSGLADEGYSPTPTSCGAGVCAATGQNVCQNGTIVNTCTPGAPQTEGPFGNPTCSDTLDNDCDSLTDVNDPNCVSPAIDQDGDGFTPNQGDCNDTDPKVYPGAPKICDGKDNDCDGRLDFTTDVDKDKDGVFWCAGDCDDNNPNRFPGNQEGPFGHLSCSDNADNDCDNKKDIADSGCMSACLDSDKDGYGVNGDPSCLNGTAIDCNDSNVNINPGMSDNNCNGVDENCSGSTDEGYTPSPTTCGTGACAATGQNICQNGAVVNTCTPGTPQTEGPAGDLTCSDGSDNDCDGAADTRDSNCSTVCVDNDGDGYGMNAHPSCPNGTVIDCNDNNSGINPGAADNNCNGVDENCSGTPDEGYTPSTTTCGTGACAATGQNICQSGTVVNTCTPGAPQTEGPYSDQTCTDAVDNDCDGVTDAADNGCAPPTVCIDNDGDGFGNPGSAACPNGSLPDCDDTDSKVYPGAPAAFCDGKDTNCDGRKDFTTDEDKDGDGAPWCAGDCNDNDPNRSPLLTEGGYGNPTCIDGIDNDCDNKTDALDAGCFPPTCGTKTSPKDGPHMFDLIRPAPEQNVTSCDWCHYDSTRTIDQRRSCQRCHADPADTSDPLNGVLKAQYPANPPYGFGTAKNVKLHASSTIGTKHGTWNPTCLTCHNPHLQEQNAKFGTTYGKYIKEYVCFDNTANGGANNQELVRFTAPTGAGSFADGVPYKENICEMCHSRTNHHRRTGDAPGDLDAGNNYTGHNDGANCMGCHPHNEGFKVISAVPPPHDTFNCTDCHVTPDTYVTNANIPNSACNTCHGIGTTGGSTKKVDRHTSATYADPTTGLLMDIKCVECHNPMKTQTNLNFVRSTIRTKAVVFTALTGANSFADGGAPYNGICEVCHTQTNHHQADGTAPGGQSHNSGTDCRCCHTHAGGFVDQNASISVPAPHNTQLCTTCHVTPDTYVTNANIPNSACQSCHAPGQSGSILEVDRHFSTAYNDPTTGALMDIKCVECHNPMIGASAGCNNPPGGQFNLKFIRSTIRTKTVVFTSYTGPNSFADGGAPYNGICEVCHTQTNHHRNDGSAPQQ
ncbi:MAG: hypothetical protein C4538_07800, partial [Nitrospiraceae bacterium]